jgi:hypothetical protein
LLLSRLRARPPASAAADAGYGRRAGGFLIGQLLFVLAYCRQVFAHLALAQLLDYLAPLHRLFQLHAPLFRDRAQAPNFRVRVVDEAGQMALVLVKRADFARVEPFAGALSRFVEQALAFAAERVALLLGCGNLPLRGRKIVCPQVLLDLPDAKQRVKLSRTPGHWQNLDVNLGLV